MFQAIYQSPWHSPAAFWAAGIAFLAWWSRRQAFLVGFFALFTVEILADALASGGWSPLAGTNSPWATPISIAFVIVGDFRYFLLVERFTRRPEGSPREPTSRAAWAAAAALSFVVPVASGVVNQAAQFADVRQTYLVYEAMFLVLALALRFVVLPRRLADAPLDVQRWLLRLTLFQVVQYGLWALSDVVILRGVDAGFLLRLIPNAMYYALFLPFVAATAPREAEA